VQKTIHKGKDVHNKLAP